MGGGYDRAQDRPPPRHPRASVQTIIRFQKKHGHVNLKPRPGRPRCTDLRHDRRIVREVE
ncbi:hypothetical protein JG688_00007508, partial [Phytophthora aleatoria]